MTSKQEQHEIDTTFEALRKRQQQVKKAKDRGYFSNTAEGQQLTRDIFIGYSRAVEAHIESKVGKAGRNAVAANHLYWQLKDLKVSYDHVSFVALRKLIDCIHTKQNQRTHVCTAIGKAIQEELRNQFFTLNLDEDGKKIRDKRLKKLRSTPKYRNLGVKLSMERRLLEKGWAKDDLYQDWPSVLCTQVGALLLDAAIKERYFEVPTKWVAKNRSEKFVVPSPALEDHLTKRTEQIDDLVTTKDVLIEPPLDWQLQDGESRFNFSGGYHLPYSRKPNNPLCRGRHYETRFGADAINLLNTLGRTAFQVDPHVFEVIDDCWEGQHSIAGFNSPFENPELGQKMPEDLKALDTKHPKRIAWRKRQAYLHEKQQEHIEKTQSAQAVLISARKNETRPRFWLSWSCDFRGRIYSQQSWLDPQSRDFERSVLRFADGCRLDEQGKEWAARAVGAAYGGTKQSYASRSQWTYDNAELIAAIASILQQASRRVFPAAFETLDWLKDLCTKAIEEGATSLWWETPCGDWIQQAEYERDHIDIETYGHGKMRVSVGSVNKPDNKALRRGFSPNYVHSFDACLLKTAFQQWDKPLVTIHDCIAVLPSDMDDAQERIRRAMVHVCQGDPLAKLADDLKVTPEALPRLEQGKGELHRVLSADKMFN